MAPPKESSKAHTQFTVIIRLPFPRGDFQEPPLVQWDASKDKRLWKLIARNPKSTGEEFHWSAWATEFGVDTSFLLQQAAWLYERHFKHVKEQMTRIRASSAVSSPVPGANSIIGSKKPQLAGNRATSSLSIRSARDSPAPRGDSSNPGTPRTGTMPPLSRTPSTNTVTQSKVLFQPSASQRALRHQGHNAARKSDSPIILEASDTKSSPISSTSDSSTSEESIRDNLSKSHAFRRPHRFSTKQTSLADVEDNDDDDDDEEDEPTFVSAIQTHPERSFKSPQQHSRQGDTGSSRDNRNSARNKVSTEGERDGRYAETGTSSKGKQRALETNESSTGSLSSPGNVSGRDKPRQKRIETLSPKHRHERRGTATTGVAGESDGTPSMGSSFSDLDDISQSALEEALASNFRQGGISRLSNLSNLSHAFKSRHN